MNEGVRNFDNFLKSESYKILKTNVGDFKIVSIQTVSFNKESISGFIVKINDFNGYSRDIMSVFDVNDPEKFTTLLRENNIKNIDGKVNGDVIWYDASYEKLNEMTIINNKISHFELYTSGKPFSLKNARFASIQSCSWQCTKEDFNCEYQSAKNECESDWLCDFPCSLNPCAISYLAAAVSACTVCNQ